MVLNRRIYKLIRNNDLNNNYFFVHYLKDTNNNNNNNITTVINSEKIEDPNKYQKIQPFTPSITAYLLLNIKNK